MQLKYDCRRYNGARLTRELAPWPDVASRYPVRPLRDRPPAGMAVRLATTLGPHLIT
jgi:hypothetical protein